MKINRIYHGHFARKRFGQSFLKDQFVIKSIISAINPRKDQAMVEIGPGLAALTKPICDHLDHLNVIELDRDLVDRLRSNPIFKSKITIYQQDAMTVSFKKIAEKMNRPLRVFGNLPYNVSIPILFHLFKDIDFIHDMHFTFQKEVANRLIAKLNSKSYGKLSIMSQYYCQVIPILEISSDAFIPSPKVDSMMVQLIPHAKMPFSVEDLHILNLITMNAFNYRRKIICNSLKNFISANELIKIGIDPTMRAENISIDQYCKIANLITSKRKYLEQNHDK